MGRIASIGHDWLAGHWLAVAGTGPRRNQARVAVASVVAIGLALVIAAVQGPHPLDRTGLGLAVLAAAIISVWRIAALQLPARLPAIAGDAIVLVALLSHTGAPTSAFYFLAVAGAWWAAAMRPPHGGITYAVTFLAVYGVIVLPGAVERRVLSEAFEDLAMLFVVAGMSDWFLALDQRVVTLVGTLRRAGPALGTAELRRRLVSAVGPTELPLDAIIAGSGLGLTTDEMELLSYLLLGLSNRQIADAMFVSEGTVKYRLGSLYRKIGVERRSGAVALARRMGLDQVQRPA
ncbi:MAG: LuxR C-terminal-related transcriptional regulator [Chloroflexi bacterium]|nr:LuxR C-terminal-related transcriptional regulator [Chloroflexota bacterium]